MSDIVNVRKFVSSLEKQEEFDGYSGVTIVVSDELEYSAGSDTGRTLTLECPWGSQKMANDILFKIRGWQYQPYTASDAHLNPAAEIGDGVSVGSVYSGIYQKDVSHGPLYTANLSAPGGEKINYKYEYKSPTTRKIERQYKGTKSSLTVLADQILAEVTARQSDTETLSAALAAQADEISAKVSRRGGSSASFGWSLTADDWTLASNGSTVLKANKNGLKVAGEIRATSGTIGGFTIKNGYLSTNSQTWGGTNTSGIYIGSSGIQLGKNFKVDSTGNMNASSGTFNGTVYAKNISGTIKANQIDADSLEVKAVNITGTINGRNVEDLPFSNLSGRISSAQVSAENDALSYLYGNEIHVRRGGYVVFETVADGPVTLNANGVENYYGQFASWGSIIAAANR